MFEPELEENAEVAVPIVLDLLLQIPRAEAGVADHPAKALVHDHAQDRQDRRGIDPEKHPETLARRLDGRRLDCDIGHAQRPSLIASAPDNHFATANL